MRAQDSSRAIRSRATSRGTVTPPPSKSVTNRAMNLALLAHGTTRIIGPLESEDTDAMKAAIRRLGCSVDPIQGGIEVRNHTGIESASIDCGASGTMLRFLTATLATRPGSWRLDGTERLRQRPLGPLLSALRELGAVIECLEVEGFAPIQIHGGSLRGGRCGLDAGASSQFLSALLMAALRARETVEIEAEALTSTPYVAITEQVMADFGAAVRRSAETFVVEPGNIGGGRFVVEADYSSACYFGAAAALTGGFVRLEGLRSDSSQGDARFFEVLRRMGAACEWSDGRLEVHGPPRLRSVVESFSDMPDQVPTLAVLAPFAEGATRVTNVGHLRHKESDRLASVAGELGSAGVEGVVEEPSALTVPGVWAETRPPEYPVSIETFEDHRIAMSFALLGLRRPGLSIADPGVVAKSYPGFWQDFQTACES